MANVFLLNYQAIMIAQIVPHTIVSLIRCLMGVALGCSHLSIFSVTQHLLHADRYTCILSNRKSSLDESLRDNFKQVSTIIRNIRSMLVHNKTIYNTCQ